MRALVVSNMQPDDAHPERGRFVRDQVSALQNLGGVRVELFEFAPGARALALAARELRTRFGPPSLLTRRPAAEPIDIVHAHFGLTAWPALAVPARTRALTVHGTDVSHPRTRLATALILPKIDLLAAASPALAAQLPGARARARALSLPCGVDVTRFTPIARADARARLGLAGDARILLFPADPARAEKRHGLALELARECSAELLALGGVDPDEVPLWVNAASAVVVPSEREGFGLAVLEALACDVPVLATPVGCHREALAGIDGTLCAPFELGSWSALANRHLAAGDARIAGRARAEAFSSEAMARRVLEQWRIALARSVAQRG